MAAGGTLTLTGGSDYVFSSTEAWSGIVGNGSTQGARLNTQGQTLSVSNLDHLIGGSSLVRKDVVTLAGTGGNTITVQALETLIGGSGNDRVLLTSTGTTMVVESIETIIGATTGTGLITLAGTTGNTMSVGYLKSLIGSAGKDVINLNAAGSVGSTMAVSLIETMIGTDGFDMIATSSAGNTVFLENVEILLGRSSSSEDIAYLGSGGNTMAVAFMETLIGGSGNDVVAMAFKTGTAQLQTGVGTLAVSSIETIVGGTGSRTTAILLDVGNTISVASLTTLIGGGGKDVVNVTLRDGTGIVGDAIAWDTNGSTMLVSLIETMIGSSGDDLVVALDNNGMTLAVSAIESVVGKAGNDVVVLGTGGNTIQVEALETLIGGTGNDVVTVRTSRGATMTVSAVESIVGNAGTDVIQLGAGGNTVQVEALETVIGGTGNDVVTVTDTTGTIFVSGVETVYTPYQTLTLSGVDTYVSLPPAVADTTPPSITAVSIPNATMKIGDVVTATITVASDSDTYTLGAGSAIGGFALANLTKVNATTYTATFTVASGGADVAAGADVPVSIVLTDSANNSNTPYTTAISQGADRIDANRPTIASAAVNGTTLTATFAEAMSATSAAGLTVTVAGQSRAATYASGSGGATLTFTLASAVAQGETVTLDYDPGTGNLTDTASNAPAAVTAQSVTNNTVSGPSITSAAYNASTNQLVVTGSGMTSGDAIGVGKLTLKGQGGNTYTLTSSDVTASSATQFTVTLNATDQLFVEGLLNKDGTAAADNTTFNLAAADDWDGNVTTGDTSVTTAGVTVSNTQRPTIAATGTTYDASTGVLTVTGTNMVHQPGATNDIDPTKLTITGQGGTRTLTAGAVEITSATSFTITLTGADKTAVNTLLNANGTQSSGSTTYNIAAAEDWNGPVFGTTADLTGNGITVSGVVAAPAYSSAVGYIGESTFTITFDSPLDTGSVPALARFGSSVDVNGTGVTVTGATISGNSVTLTIQTSLLPGDVIDFVYTDPAGDDASGVLQSASGGLDVASFSHSIVIAITRPAPTLQSAAVNGATLVLTYDSALDATNIPATSAFAVSASGNPVSVTNVTVNSANKTVTLTLAQAALTGQTVTVSYTDPTAGDDTNAIQNTGGADAASFSAHSVTNNTVGTPPTIDLNGAGTGTGNTVTLSGATTLAAATAADAENDTSNWNNGSLTVQRFTGGSADATSNDAFSFAGGASFADTGSALTINSGATTFATYTNSGGVLTISFNANATTTLVQDVIQHIAYANTKPYGDATIRFSLNDGTTATTADVSVTSSSIYVTATTDTSDGNAANGFSLREALARGVAQSGADTIFLDGITTGTTLTLSGGTATLGDGDGIMIAPGAGAKMLTIGGGIVLVGSTTIGDFNGQSITISATLSGSGSLTKASAGALTLSGPNSYTGGTTLNNGTLTLSGGSALADDGAVTVAGGTLALGANETIGTLTSTGGTLTLAGHTLTASGVTLDASGMARGTSDTGTLTTSNTTGTAITGTSGDDSITGFTGSDTLTGSDGNDTLAGGDGNDTADTLIGGNGDDTFVYASHLLLTNSGNSFIDSIDGGAGTDTLLFTPTSTFTFGSGLDWSSRISGIERIAFGATSATLNMTLNANAYTEGLRTIDLSGDTNASGTGNVILNRITGGGMTVIGSAGTDSIVGGSGDDTLSGGAGNDTINGGNGNDVITGGAGTDSLTGGAGNDTFVGSVSDLNGDTITDLAAGDAILLTGVSGLTAANIRVTGSGATAKVEIDTNATTFSTAEVTLNTANLANVGFVVTTTNGGNDMLFRLVSPSTVTGVSSSTTDGAYKVGSTISIQVTFSEAVTVTGTPQLTLETGTTDRTIDYAGGTGTSTLTFTYTVQAGDTSSDLDYLSTTALALNGGTIRNASGYDAVLTLPTPGATNSLGDNKAIVLDTTAPATTVATAAFSADTAANGGTNSDFITKTAGQTVSGTLSANLAAGETVYVSLDNGSTWTAATATVGQNTWSLAGQTLTGSSTLKAKVTDTAGNDGTVYSQAYVLDTTAPTVTIGAISTDDRLNATEAGAALTISGTSSGAEDGQTVTVGLNGQTYTGTVSSGAWSVTVGTGALGALVDQSYTVTADVSDLAGNAATQVTHSLSVDKSAPTVTIGAISTDNRINAGESNGAVTVAGATSEVEDGRTVLVTVGGVTKTATVTANAWSVSLSSGEVQGLTEGSVLVTANVSDLAGNTATQASRTITYDKTAPAVVIGSGALSNSAAPTLSGTAEVGSTVIITVAGATYTTTPATDGVWSVDLASATPASGTLTLNTNSANAVSVTATDAAGNASSPATQSLVLDTTAPTLAISLGSTTLGVDETTTVTFTFSEAPAGFAIGDITVPNGVLSNLTLVSGSNGLVYTATLTPTADFVADNNRISVSTGWSDAAGNAPASIASSGAYSIDTRHTTGSGAPSLGGAVAGQTVNDTAPVAPFAGFTIADSDASQSQTVVVKLRNSGGTVGDATGAFTAASLTASGFTKTAAGTYSLTAASAAAAQAALRLLSFQPTANRVAPGASEVAGFTVTVTDATSLSSSDTTTTVSALSINDSPTLVKTLGTGSATQGQAFSFTVPAGSFGDVDVGDSLTYTATKVDGTALPSWLSFNATTGVLSGTPANADVGTQVVRVTATDSHGAATSDVLIVQVADVNDAPVAQNDAAATDKLTALSVTAAKGVLANDSDPDVGDRPVVSAVAGSADNVGKAITLSGGGKLTLSADGRYSFDPAGAYASLAAGQTQQETVSYTITDRAGATATATLTLTVSGVNTAPTAQATKLVDIDQNSSKVGLSIDKPVDPEGDPLTITVAGLPTVGTLQRYDGTAITVGSTLTPDQLAGVVYTPPFGVTGTAGSFTYTVSDGTNTVTRAVSISVTPVQWLSLTPSVVVAAEGNSGVSSMVFTVTRSGDTSGSTTVNWQVDAPADSGLTGSLADATDFGGVLPSGAITFAAGETSKTIAVQVSGDKLVESNELYRVNLVGSSTTVSNAKIEVVTKTAIGTILNDDVAATVKTVTGPSSGRYLAARGDVLDFTVAFSDSVTVTSGTPRLALTIGNQTRYATYDRPASGKLIFRYVVAAADLDTDGIALGGAIDLNGGTITDSAGNVITNLQLAQVSATDKVLVNVRGGHAIDGYISGATVFADANANGVLDSGEVSGTTDAVGTWSINGGTGPIIMIGGTDISTTLAFTGVYEAPATASVITPLTTVIVGMTGLNGTITDIANAMTELKNKLGLDGSLDLLNYDPIVAATATGASASAIAIALKTQAVSASIANLITQGSAVLTGSVTGTAPAAGVIGEALVTAIADAVKALPSGSTLDLTNTTVLAGILTAAGAKVSAVDTTKLAGLVTQSASVIAASNGAVVRAGTQTNAVSGLTQIAQAQVVAQGAATDQLLSGSTSGDVSGAVSGFTGTSLDTKISAAQAGVVVPARLAIAATDADKREGDSGFTDFTFTLTRSGNSSGALSVTWSVAANGTLDAADFGGTLPAGTVTFADGDTSQTITVRVSGDTDIEPDEAFTVTLASPSVVAPAIDTASATGTIRNEDPINPLLTLPSAQTVVAGAAAGITGLMVADGDSASVSATLTPTNGTLSLGGPATVSASGTGYQVTGSVADVNTTLATLVFTGTTGKTAGSIAVTLADDDPTTPDASGTLSITLQSPPATVLPSRPTVIAGVSTEVLGIRVTDVDGGTMTVTLTPTSGTITLPLAGSATATDLGGGKLRLTGSLADVNETLAQLEFTATPHVTGASILIETADDQPLTADASGTLTMDVLSPPEQTVPATLAVTAGQATAVGGLTVSDFDSTLLQVTLTPTSGSLALTAQGRVSVSQPTAGAWRLVGTQSDLAATLATLTYTGTAGQTAGTITVATTDLDGRTPVVQNSVVVSIANLPTVTVPTLTNLVSGTPVLLSGLSVADANNRTLTVHLTASGGTLAMSPAAGVMIVTNQDGSLTATGDAASLDSAFAALSFTGTVGMAQATLQVDVDAGGGLTASSSTTMTLSTVPVLSLPQSALTLVAGNATAVSGISVSNTGSAVATVKLTPGSGTVAVTATSGVQVSDLGGGAIALVGTATALNTALATLTVTPAGNGTTGTLAITVEYAGNVLASLSGSLAATIIHAPALTLPQPVTVDPDIATALTGIQIADPDGNRMTVTLTPTQAALAVTASGQAVVSTAPNGTVMITGSVADVNATLSALSITAARATAASIAVTVGDGTSTPAATGTLTLPVLDRTPPAAPVISGAFIDGAATSPLSLANRGGLVIRGTAEAGSSVALSDGVTLVATVTAGADGRWVVDLGASPLSDGSHSLTAKATDAAGNTGTASTALTVGVDTTAPTIPTLSFANSTVDKASQTSVGFTINGGEVGTIYRWTLSSSGGGTPLTGTGTIGSASDVISGLDVSGLYDGSLSLSLTLTDSAGNMSGAGTASATKATAVTIDGAQVQTLSGQSNGQATSTVVIQPPGSGRVEDPTTANASLADVPVMQEMRTVNGTPTTVTTLQVSLPNGVGVTASGPTSRGNPTQSLADLIREIDARTMAGTDSRSGLEGGGTSFLSLLPQTTSLLVRTFDFAANTTPSQTPVRISGVVQTDGTPTALVINTSALSGSLPIQLDNVEFAAVIGNATLTGGDGNQVVYGDSASQFMVLGAGDDLLSGGGGNDTVMSTLGNDTLFGDGGDDIVNGGVGNDWVLGGDGNDLVGGGEGNDTGFGGAGNDILFGEDGNDTLSGDTGNDTVSGGAGNDLVFGGDGADFVIGDDGDDTLSAGDGNDTALGGTGNDLIGLGSGDDLASGGEGNDTLFGEEGNDTLFGGAGNDAINGGAGNDVLFADGGADTLWGGDGSDIFAFGSGSGGSVIMDFQAGTDRIALYDASVDLAAVMKSATVVNGSTVFTLAAGQTITVVGQTGSVAGWFG